MKRRSPRVLLEQMLEAAKMALAFVEGMEKASFPDHSKTQQVVSRRIVWDTVLTDAPQLVYRLPEMIAASAASGANDSRFIRPAGN